MDEQQLLSRPAARRRAGACGSDRALQRLCRDGHSQPEPRASFSGGRGRACFKHIFRALAVLPDSQGREHPRVAWERCAKQDRRPAAKGAYGYAAGRRAGRNRRFSSRGDCQKGTGAAAARGGRAAVRGRPRDHPAVYDLCQTAPEIAAVLGLTPSAVRMRLVRSREAIKNELCRGGFVYE